MSGGGGGGPQEEIEEVINPLLALEQEIALATTEVYELGLETEEAGDDQHPLDPPAPAAGGTPHITGRTSSRLGSSFSSTEGRRIRFEAGTAGGGNEEGEPYDIEGIPPPSPAEQARLRAALNTATDKIRDLREMMKTKNVRRSRMSSTSTYSMTGDDSVSSTKPKLQTPAIFNGEYTEEYCALNWLAQCERYLGQCKVNHAAWADYARSYMGKVAQAWMDAEFGITSPVWDTLSVSMKIRFVPPDHALRVELKFEVLCQGSSSLTAYVESYQKIDAALMYAEASVSNQRKVLRFIKGLSSSQDRRFLLERDPQDLKEVYKGVHILRQAMELSSDHRGFQYRGGIGAKRFKRLEKEKEREKNLMMLQGQAKTKAFKEGRCIGCGKSGHMIAQCPDVNKVMRKMQKYFAWTVKAKRAQSNKSATPERKKKFKRLEAAAGASSEDEEDDDEEDEDSEEDESSSSDDNEGEGNQPPESEG